MEIIRHSAPFECEEVLGLWEKKLADTSETIFGEKFETGHENIEFEAYFGTGESKESSVVSDVNNEELAISMKIDVQESGYLKDAKVEILEAEEGNGLNFEEKEFEELKNKYEELRMHREEGK